MSTEKKEGEKRPSAVQEAMDLIRPGLTLFHDEESVGYASVKRDGHMETYRVNGDGLRRWIASQFYRHHKRPLKSADMGELLSLLDAQAVMDGPAYRVFMRVANQGNQVYLDLGSPTWEVVEVTGDGWRVIPADSAPVRFRRAPGMLPLPAPEQGGNLDELRDFLNCDEDGFILGVAWKIAALHGSGPFPILVIGGRQGTGKTTASRVIRGTIDPSTASDRGAPKDERDAVIACANAFVQSWDNLSSMKPELSDTACRIATGAGFSTRKLFTDGDEHITYVRRPIMVNGIPDLLSRGDFAERALVVHLQPIPDHKRRTETEFWERFKAAQPRILGALLDVLSGALRRLPDTRLDRMPRMADFARLIAAAEPDCPWDGGDFMRAYEAGRQEAAVSVLEGDAVAQAVMRLGTRHRDEKRLGPIFEGSTSDLLVKLTQVGERGAGWPGSTKALVNHLERIGPALQIEGYRVTRSRTNAGRLITLSFLFPTKEEEASQASQTPQTQQSCGFERDASSDGCALEPSQATLAPIVPIKVEGKRPVTSVTDPPPANPRHHCVSAGGDTCDASSTPVWPHASGDA